MFNNDVVDGKSGGTATFFAFYKAVEEGVAIGILST